MSVIVNEYFVFNYWECNDYEKIVEILTEKFLKAHIPSSSHFDSLKYHDYSDFEIFLRKKIQIRLQLKIRDTIIQQGLTDGLKFE